MNGTSEPNPVDMASDTGLLLPVKTSVWPTYMGPVTPIAEGRLEIAATLEPKVGSM